MRTKTIITTVFALLFFMNSCTKTNNGITKENDPIQGIQYRFTLIDKDSNNLYKYPDVLNTKYDPHQLYAIGNDGDTMQKIYVLYRSETDQVICNIDTLSKGSIFSIWLIDNLIKSINNIYYIHYNTTVIDTLLVNPYKNMDRLGYFEYNKDTINWYTGSNKFYYGNFLIIK